MASGLYVPDLQKTASQLTWTDKARFEDFIAQKQGLSARSRSRGRPMERSESGMALNSPKVVAGPTIIE